MIAVVDYGVNNIRSVVRALEAAGAECTVVTEATQVLGADRLLLPGVGHFGKAMNNLRALRLDAAIRSVAQSGRPVLGICLGMQLCFGSSEEAPGVEGLGLMPGRVVRFGNQLPVPHVGWAQVTATPAGAGHSITGTVFQQPEQFFYHVHSYHAADVPAGASLATADYIGGFPTIVAHGNVAGFQFHPEKSQSTGIALLKQFVEWTP